MVRKWIHIDMKAHDPWILPIWTAVARAAAQGGTRELSKHTRELGLHLSTRLAMLPHIAKRLTIGLARLEDEISKRESHHEWKQGTEGCAFPIPENLQYGLLVDIDALLFELNAACEQFVRLFARLHAHAGLPIKKARRGKEIARIIKDAGHDPGWFASLDRHRNLFIHRATPYFAVDLTKAPATHDLLIMKSNIKAFDDENEFVRLSELAAVVEGFVNSKRVLQDYLISLFST